MDNVIECWREYKKLCARAWSWRCRWLGTRTIGFNCKMQWCILVLVKLIKCFEWLILIGLTLNCLLFETAERAGWLAGWLAEAAKRNRNGEPKQFDDNKLIASAWQAMFFFKNPFVITILLPSFRKLNEIWLTLNRAGESQWHKGTESRGMFCLWPWLITHNVTQTRPTI